MAGENPSNKNNDSSGGRRLSAIALSRGVGVGQIEFLDPTEFTEERLRIDPAMIETEVERLRAATLLAREVLSSISQTAIAAPNEQISGIFDSHILILESLSGKIEQSIRESAINAEWAISRLKASFGEKVLSGDKHTDIRDVLDRLLAEIKPTPDTNEKPCGTVIAVRELRPSIVMELSRRQPAAFVVEHGGWTSHASILARELGIPMVSGIKLSADEIGANVRVLVDGNFGEIVIDPDDETLKRALDSSIRDDVEDAISEHDRGNGPIQTTDGIEISIRVNLEALASYQSALDAGASGIGLYRSELLIPKSGIVPSEETQVDVYRKISAMVGTAGINIRTFDVGRDSVDMDSPIREGNPSLGLRSIRLSLSDQRQFRTQLRSILKANILGNIRIVLPLVSGVAEVLRTKAILAEEAERLVSEGVEINQPALGAMIEVPSAVFMAREIAENVDFLCLGTNDLVQYLLAVDRDNELVAEWYQTLHPAVLRAVKAVVVAGATVGIPVAVCGEMAGSAFYIPLLLGLGVRELSMSVNSIRPVRRLVWGISVTEATDLAAKAGYCSTAEEVESILRRHYIENWSELFPPGILNSPLL